MKIKKILIILCISSMSLTACGVSTPKSTETLEVVSEDTIIGGAINLSEQTGSEYVISQGGSHILEGEFQGQIIIDTNEDVIIVCNGVSVINESGPAIYVKNSKNLTLDLAKDTVNTFVDGGDYLDTESKGTLYTNESLLITGEGELNLEANYKHAISSKDLTIEDGSINIVSTVNDGINNSGNLIINGGNITIEAEDDGIQTTGTIEINDGNLNVKALGDGLQSEGVLTINNGSINISQSNEGIESKDSIIINNGNIEVVSTDDGMNATNNIVINNGNIVILSSQNDAIDSNGTIEIYGGSIEALGGMGAEGGLDCDNSAVKISGGTVLASGGTNSSVSSDNQYVVLIGAANKDEVLSIKLENEEVFTYTVKKDFSNMILSSDIFQVCNTYSLLKNGIESLTFETTEDSNIVEAGGSNQGMRMGNKEFRNQEEFGGMPVGERPAKGEMPENMDMFWDKNENTELEAPYFEKGDEAYLGPKEIIKEE